MTPTINELWNGNISPAEHCGDNDLLISELHSLMEKNRKNLSSGLSVSQMEIFQKYMDCSEEYLFRMLELAFCDGFCLGTKLVAEAFQ